MSDGISYEPITGFTYLSQIKGLGAKLPFPYKHLCLAYAPTQYQELTFKLALQNLAAHFNLEFHEYRYQSYETGFDAFIEFSPAIIFFVYDPNREAKVIHRLKAKNPNSLLIQISGDTHYYKIDPEIFSLVDLHIDAMFCVKEKLKGIGTPFAHFYWNISESLINRISSLKLEGPKQFDFISLLGGMTTERQQLVEAIKARKTILYSLKEYNIDRLCQRYSECKYVLGTSTSCACFFNGPSMKGFRDWIGPFTDTLLIYDDIDEMKPLKNIVPLYRYGNYGALFDLIERLDANEEHRQNLLNAQRQWALNHSLEKQFGRLLLQHAKAPRNYKSTDSTMVHQISPEDLPIVCPHHLIDCQDRRSLLNKFLDMRHSKCSEILGAEVGICEGKHISQMLLDNPNATMLGVDRREDPALQSNIFPFGPRFLFAHCSSNDPRALTRFPPESFQFIYIDAGHTYPDVMQDLQNWWPLLAPGGLFFGDDYLTAQDHPEGVFGVIEALEEFTKQKQLKYNITGWDRFLQNPPTTFEQKRFVAARYWEELKPDLSQTHRTLHIPQWYIIK